CSPSSSSPSGCRCSGPARPSDGRAAGASGWGGPMTHPKNGEIERYTDHYFNRTKQVIGRFGDSRVTYAIFMRRPVVFAPRLALDWLKETTKLRQADVEIDLRYSEGKWVGAGEPMMYITGSFFHLVDLETIFLQKLGPACVAAYNAWTMCADMPKAAFLAM